MPLQFDRLTSRGLRRLVHDLRQALVEVGQPPMPQHLAQEVVARQLGHASWQAAHRQATLVDRRPPSTASAPSVAPALSAVVPARLPSPTPMEHPTMSDETVMSLPIYPVKISPEAEAVLTLMRQGQTLYDTAGLYHAFRQEQEAPKTSDEADKQMRRDNMALALALATTPGPLIQGWRMVELPDLERSIVPADGDRVMMKDTPFRLLTDLILDPNNNPTSLPLQPEDIEILVSEVYRYDPNSPFLLLQHGHMKADSSLRELLESPSFKEEIQSDLPAALVRVRPLFADAALSYADVMGGLQRLVHLIAKAHPASNFEARLNREDKPMRNPVRLGYLTGSAVVTLQSTQERLGEQLMASPRIRMADAVAGPDAASQERAAQFRATVRAIEEARAELPTIQPVAPRRSRRP